MANIETAYVKAFQSNIVRKFQQEGSRLRPYVRIETQRAEEEFYDRILPRTATKLTTRHQDTPLQDTDYDRRRVTMADWADGELIDSEDKIRMLADPTSPIVANMAAAMGRALDQTIIDAAFATAYSGKEGGTSVAHPAGSVVEEDENGYQGVTSSTVTNLSINKLREIRYRMEQDEVLSMGETIYLAVTASQLSSLLRQDAAINADYNTVRALVSGEIDTFMGIRFIRTELLAKSGNIRSCIAFTPSGLLAAMGAEINVSIDRRPDKNNAMQLLCKGSFGATRMWEEAVLEVQCDETK